MKSSLKIVGTSVLVATICGSFTGLVESLALLNIGTNPYLSRFVIIDCLVVYSAVWGIAGLLIGIVLGILHNVIRIHTSTFLSTFFILFSTGYLIGYYTNYIYLPEVFSKTSMTFDVLLFVVLTVVGIVTYRKISPTVSGPTVSGKRGKPSSYLNWRNVILLWLVCISAGSVAGMWPEDQAADRQELFDSSALDIDRYYNVLIIVIDALRKDHMSFYDYGRDTTPNINRIFSDGVWFSHAFSQSSHTKPSTASLLTSLYVSTHKMSQLTTGLPKNAVTAPQIFRALGYRTSIFSVNSFVSPFFGYDKGVDYFYVTKQREINSTGLYNTLVKVARKSIPVTREISRRIIDVINVLDSESFIFSRKRSKVDDESVTREFLKWVEKNKENRFFSYVHYLAPHSPYKPPRPYNRLYVPYPGTKRLRNPEFSGFLPFNEGKPLSEKELANMIGQYDGEINFVDNQIGIVMDRLRELKLEKNTLVILTSDHGEEFYDHHGWRHGQSLYNEVINVPLIIWQPSLMEREGELTVQVQHVDLLPTILDLLGFPIPGDLQGTSYAQLLRHTSGTFSERPIITELDFGGQGARSIIKGNQKLIYSYHGIEKSTMLFDIGADAKETEELSVSEPEEASALRKELEAFLKKTSRDEIKSEKLYLNENMKDELRELGYIE